MSHTLIAPFLTAEVPGSAVRRPAARPVLREASPAYGSAHRPAPTHSRGGRATSPQPRTTRFGATQRQAALRLTSRGRVVVVVALLLVALVAIGLGRLGSGSAAADHGQPTPGQVADTWVVQPGQTLWSIAERVAPNTDPRDTVARIVDLNDLPSSGVVAGQQIFVPAS